MTTMTTRRLKSAARARARRRTAAKRQQQELQLRLLYAHGLGERGHRVRGGLVKVEEEAALQRRHLQVDLLLVEVAGDGHGAEGVDPVELAAGRAGGVKLGEEADGLGHLRRELDVLHLVRRPEPSGQRHDVPLDPREPGRDSADDVLHLAQELAEGRAGLLGHHHVLGHADELGRELPPAHGAELVDHHLLHVVVGSGLEEEALRELLAVELAE